MAANQSSLPLSQDSVSRLVELSRPHLSCMLNRANVRYQDHDELMQETVLGFYGFLHNRRHAVDVSRSLLPVLVDIMKKRIADYHRGHRWTAQSMGGTVGKEVLGRLSSRERDTVVQARSAWEKHPDLEHQTLAALRDTLDTDVMYVLVRRRECPIPTLQQIAGELGVSIGKVHQLKTRAEEAFRLEFAARLKSIMEPVVSHSE